MSETNLPASYRMLCARSVPDEYLLLERQIIRSSINHIDLKLNKTSKQIVRLVYRIQTNCRWSTRNSTEDQRYTCPRTLSRAMAVGDKISILLKLFSISSKFCKTALIERLR